MTEDFRQSELRPTPMFAITRWSPFSLLARSTILGIFWQGMRVSIQALWVIAIARLLGPSGYGTFAGISGLANAMGGLVGLGLGLVMYRDVARVPAVFGDRWRKTIVVSVVTGILFGTAFLLLGKDLGGYAGMQTVLAIVISELLFFPIVTAACFAFAAHERMGWAVALPALLGGTRLIAVAAFYWLDASWSLADYVWFHTAATASFACIAVILVHVLLRPVAVPFSLRLHDLRDGLGFSAVWATGNALSSLDKALVLRLSGSEIAGVYSSAYRFATILAVPMDALVTAAMPRLFRGSDGTTLQQQLVARLLWITLAYGVLAGCVLWLAAELLPWLLGEDFAAATRAAQFMGLLLPCLGMRVLGGNILMAIGLKTERVLIECGGLVFLVLTGIWLLPRLGLDGALIMVISTEIFLCVATWIVVLRRHFARTRAVGIPEKR